MGLDKLFNRGEMHSAGERGKVEVGVSIGDRGARSGPVQKNVLSTIPNGGMARGISISGIDEGKKKR